MSWETERLLRYLRKQRGALSLATIASYGPTFTRDVPVLHAAIAELEAAGLVDVFPGNPSRRGSRGPFRPTRVQRSDKVAPLQPGEPVAPHCYRYLKPPWTKYTVPRNQPRPGKKIKIRNAKGQFVSLPLKTRTALRQQHKGLGKFKIGDKREYDAARYARMKAERAAGLIPPWATLPLPRATAIAEWRAIGRQAPLEPLAPPRPKKPPPPPKPPRVDGIVSVKEFLAANYSPEPWRDEEADDRV